jgi:hypothetical protein
VVDHAVVRDEARQEVIERRGRRAAQVPAHGAETSALAGRRQWSAASFVRQR